MASLGVAQVIYSTAPYSWGFTLNDLPGRLRITTSMGDTVHPINLKRAMPSLKRIRLQREYIIFHSEAKWADYLLKEDLVRTRSP